MLALLGGTAVAFALTEGLKLEHSPISRTRVDKVFSPVCHCPTRVARIAFRLRDPDTLTVAIVDAGSKVVRTLLDRRSFNRGLHGFSWNGRGDDGAILPDGAYRPRLRLGRGRRTIVLPNPIRLDTRPPHVRILSVGPRTFSPDGDGRADGVVVRYRLDEPARALLLVDGVQRVRTLRVRVLDRLEWFGKDGGRTLPPGTYRLALAAEDLAGNRSRPTPARPVLLRYIALAGPARAPAGSAVRFHISTDARAYRWRLGAAHGAGRGPLLVLRAPGPGRYVLVVRAAGHAARERLVVGARP